MAAAATGRTMAMSKQELRAEWVKALRSGEYRQSHTSLEDGNGNCCLGVLCRIFDRVSPGVIQVVSDGTGARFDGHAAYPPKPVTNAIGLRTVWGDFRLDGHEIGNSLAALNDGGKSFDEIADVIESNPPGLFVD